jgi:3-dehydroquinate synthase
VSVALGPRSYAIQIGNRCLAELPQVLEAGGRVSHVVVIADESLRGSHAAAAIAALQARGLRVDLLTVPSGEPSKATAEAARLWDELLRVKADRKSVIVAVGGGVTGDLAGFVAATFARGLAFVQVPTTLLAMVDSSVGGKVGINLPGAKNMVGAFWQPRGVLIDTDLLATLPEREFRAGLAEVIKYGVILDAEFFEYLESHLNDVLERKPEALVHVIARSCELKAQVVEADEREETGLRAVLNYGHTFAHALEAVAGYGELLHGEAVAIGMHWAARLAASLGRIEEGLIARQKALLMGAHLPVEAPYDRQQLLAAMQSDKKTEHGKLRFVLPDRLGHVELVGNIDPQAVQAAMVE